MISAAIPVHSEADEIGGHLEAFSALLAWNLSLPKTLD
jgi:hypothetical protein